MDRYTEASGYPYEGDIVNIYLNHVKQAIITGAFQSAKRNLIFAKEAGAKDNDVTNLETKIKMAEKNKQRILNGDRYTEAKGYPYEGDIVNIYLNHVKQAIITGAFQSAKRNLIFAKETGAKENDVTNLETKIKMAEAEWNKQRILNQARKCTQLVKKALKEGYIENAEKILIIAQKVYPEHDFGYIREEILATKSANTDCVSKGIAPKSIDMNIKETYNKENKRIQQNYGEYAFVHKDKNIRKLNNEIIEDGGVGRPNRIDDLKGSSKNNNNKDHTANNDIANREQADCCLKIAKTALEDKDIAKAERLAIKADRMYPSEEAKTLLAKILQMKSSVKDREVKSDNTILINTEDQEEAQKCLHIAFNAFSNDDIEKCKRFLKKAKTFDKSINTDIYMTELQQKKAQKEHDKSVAEKLKKKHEKPSTFNTIGKAAKNTMNFVGNAADVVLGKVFGISLNFNAQIQDTKPAQEKETKREYRSFSNCVQNKSHSHDGKNNNVVIETKCEMKDEAKNKNEIVKGEAERQTKASDLVKQAKACTDERNSEQTEVLLTGANVLCPATPQQELMNQIQRAAMNETKTELAENDHQNNNNHPSKKEEKETYPKKNMMPKSGEPTSEIVEKKRRIDYKPTAYEENMKHLNKKVHPKKTFYNSQRKRMAENTPNSSENKYYLRARNGYDPVVEAKSLREMGMKAYREKQLDETEKLLLQSDSIYPDGETRNIIDHVRAEKNTKGTPYLF